MKMITPNKYMDLNTSLIKVSSDILKILLKKRDKTIKYNKLSKELEKLYGEDTDYVLIPSLNFLFLVDKIKYNLTDDTLELII